MVDPGDRKLVNAETAVDALSYFALKDPPKARYVSTAGALNSIQPALILAAINNCGPAQK